MFLENLTKFTQVAKKMGVYPNIRTISGPSSGTEVIIDKKKLLTFSTNNYLSLAQDKRLIDSAIGGIKIYGIGPTSARLMSGNLDIYDELEKKTAEYIGHESCVAFSSGYMANLGTIAAVAKPPYAGAFSFFKKSEPTLIVSDEFNHASIIDGCKLSGAEKAIFKHNDMEDLEKILIKNKKQNILIVVDGVYSMDGDITPLDKVVMLKYKYNCALMVDDAHATGVLGKTGRGSFEHFGLKATDIDILMGTYVKAFGSVGGFICCNKGLSEYLKVSARSYVFSISVPPSCAKATITAIGIMSRELSIREKLIDNTNYLRRRLKKLGFNTLNSETPIIPILIGDEKKTKKVEEFLFEKNILAPSVTYPAVKKGNSRIRLSVMADHTNEQIDYLIEHLEIIGKKLRIIK